MSDFYFKMKGEDLSKYTILWEGSEKSFEEISIDVAKVKAEIFCREHRFNAFIYFDVVSNRETGTVTLTGIPARVKYNIKHVAGNAIATGIDVGLDIGSAAGRSVASFFKKWW